jgi:hypothetical protein
MRKRVGKPQIKANRQHKVNQNSSTQIRLINHVL